MELRIKIEDLKKLDITLTQYVFIWSLYNQVKVAYIDITEEGLSNLIGKGYMSKTTDYYALTPKGADVFEPNDGSFGEFIRLFPTRVSDINGVVRVLSPADPLTLVGEKLKRKWYSITKNKTELTEKIINCLKREVELRKRDGSLYWMRNAETWLNKATWEDYEYLLDKPTQENREGKMNEIKL